MTLTPIETEFSHLLSLMRQEEYPINLLADGPLMNPIHPRLIWSRLQFQSQSDESQSVSLAGWSYTTFADLSAAKKFWPGMTQQFTGRPWNIYEFIQGSDTEALIDFQDWGVVAISKSDHLQTQVGRELHHYALPVWLSYALSPELWGAQGKWMRFHQNLMKVLEERQLLRPGSSVGRYFLDSKTQSLANKGFLGSHLDDSYVLVLPWSFSLTSLKRLIHTIEQEF